MVQCGSCINLCSAASWETAVRTEVASHLNQVSLVDLRPAKTYNVRMFAVNALGTSDVSNVLTITTKEAGIFRFKAPLQKK